jgi:hypothetical protein
MISIRMVIKMDFWQVNGMRRIECVYVSTLTGVDVLSLSPSLHTHHLVTHHSSSCDEEKTTEGKTALFAVESVVCCCFASVFFSSVLKFGTAKIEITLSQ